MPYEFILGVDTDEKAGHAAVAVIEKARHRGEEVTTYHVRLLERRDAADEEALAQHIQNVVGGVPYVGRTRVVVNRTERPGRRLLELLTRTGLTSIGASISEGDSATQNGPGIVTNTRRSPVREGGFIISRHDLIQTTLDLYGAGQLGMEQDSPEVSSLAGSLQDYINRSPVPTDAEQGVDLPPRVDAPRNCLTFATALACWYGSQLSLSPDGNDGEIPDTGPVKAIRRADTV